MNIRIGETSLNGYGSEMTIVKYINSKDIIVEFKEYDYRIKTEYSLFLKGSVSCPYDKSVYGVGYLGEGKHTKKTAILIYDTWHGMLRRCYSKGCKQNYPSYKDCTVCKEWHNFQEFVKWFDRNYYKIVDQRMELDKDILVKGNKIYSPETCVFAPRNINALFTKTDKKRGTLPIGVYSEDNKFVAHYSNKGKVIRLGSYETSRDAFNIYKIYKAEHIKRIADKYKYNIPKILYDAMYHYKVDIND